MTIVAPRSFVEWIESYGVTAYPVRFNPQEVMESIAQSKNLLQAMRAMREVVENGAMEAMQDCWQAAQDCDFLLQTGTGGNALEIAATRKIPVAFAQLIPAHPTRTFPHFLLPLRASLGGRYNLLTHTLVRGLLWNMMGASATNRWRERLGLPRWRSEAEMLAYTRSLNAPVLYGYSSHLIPRPQDWDDNQHITGYWFLDPPPAWQPPPDLVNFLESGPAPVYIGFGSMSHEHPEQQTRLALRALEISGQRGVLMTGWGGLERATAPPNVYFTNNIPHAWLFPRMAAVVHHGGAGTTAEGLRAGVPSIIPAFGGDQCSWADLVVKAGAGPRVPGIRGLTAEKLARAIHASLNDSAMRARAAALGEKIRAEDGVSCAVRIIHNSL